jgi:hypothetical protein
VPNLWPATRKKFRPSNQLSKKATQPGRLLSA